MLGGSHVPQGHCLSTGQHLDPALSKFTPHRWRLGALALSLSLPSCKMGSITTSLTELLGEFSVLMGRRKAMTNLDSLLKSRNRL